MQKRYGLLILVFALIFGTTVASLPRAVKAPIGPNEVRFYVVPTITPASPAGAYVVVEVWVESEPGWDNTPEGIVGYALSARVDPRALEIMTAGKIPGAAGFLEDFLARYFYDFMGYTTAFLVGPIDKDTGTITDCSEYIMGYSTLGVGAGGGPIKLMRFLFKSRSDVIPSVIDLFGRYVTELSATYTTPDGLDHYVDIMEDGYYIADTSTSPYETMYFDSSPAWASDPFMNVTGTDWHELWPQYCDWWTLEGWIDNGDGVLSASDQIYMINIGTGEDLWFHVEWVNPTPGAGDGGADLIVTTIPPVPEFPLGIGLMIMLAPAIPIGYLWRLRKKVTKQ
ncbi:MAG: hypothetical protein ACE5I5_20145 [Candidatus Heimdallarchaeota archaeon]